MRANRIEDAHLTQLEQHCTEAQQQVQRWLNSVKEKVAWCGDTAGDRYSVEAKLATIKVVTFAADTHSSFTFCITIFFKRGHFLVFNISRGH